MKTIKAFAHKKDIFNSAGDVLINCNAKVNPLTHKEPAILKKGEGKTIGGSGKTNYQVYSDLLTTLWSKIN